MNPTFLFGCCCILLARSVAVAAPPDPSFPLKEDAVVTFRSAVTPALVHYFAIGDDHYEVEVRPCRFYPVSRDLTDVKITNIYRDTEEALIPRQQTESSGAGSDGRRVPADRKVTAYKYVVRLRHSHLGKGEIHIKCKSQKALLSARNMLQVLGFFFSGDLIRPQARFYENSRGIVHYAGSGHVPAGAQLLHSASAGSARCALCFPKFVPFPLLQEERLVQMQLSSSIRNAYFQSNDSDFQNKVDSIGRRILLNWTGRLKGYEYEFIILKRAGFNAFACPAGLVFVSEDLLKTLDDDEEIEAVLAHEIAHVEMRHSLKELLKARRSAANAAIVGVVAQIGTAAVAANNNLDPALATSVIGAVGMIASTVAFQIMMNGYSIEHEKEADVVASMYFQKSGRSSAPLLRVLKKLRTDLNNRRVNTRLASETHPSIEQRLYLTEHCTVTLLESDHLFDLLNNEDELLCTMKIVGVCNYQEIDGRNAAKIFTDVETFTNLEADSPVHALSIRQKNTTLSFAAEQLISLPPLTALSIVFTRAGQHVRLEEGYLPFLSGIKVKKSMPKQSF